MATDAGVPLVVARLEAEDVLKTFCLGQSVCRRKESRSTGGCVLVGWGAPETEVVVCTGQPVGMALNGDFVAPYVESGDHFVVDHEKVGAPVGPFLDGTLHCVDC